MINLIIDFFSRVEIYEQVTLLQLLELFGAGTACVVSPISYIEYVGQGLHIPTVKQQNPVYRSLLRRLLDIQYGHVTNHPWALEVD